MISHLMCGSFFISRMYAKHILLDTSCDALYS